MGITGKDAGFEIRRLDDLAKVEKGDDLATSLARGVVKGVAVIVKLLVGIRGNQVAIMKKMGIELRKPRDREGRDRPDTNETTK